MDYWAALLLVYASLMFVIHLTSWKLVEHRYGFFKLRSWLFTHGAFPGSQYLCEITAAFALERRRTNAVCRKLPA